MWQAYTPWPGIFTHYEGKRLLLEGVSESPPPEKGESEGVTQKGIPNSETPPNLPFSGEEPNPGQVIKLEDGQIGVVCSE
jgi:hypothetical protein